MRLRPTVCVAIGLALVCMDAQAQLTMSGRVVDETGAGVAGARVELRLGEGKPLVASSDPAGNFKLALPTAGDYEIRAEHEGFYVFRGHGQRLDETKSQLTITLNHEQEFPERVDVKASPTVIDPQQPADRKALDNTEIQTVPYAAPQDYRNALQLLNGVVPDNSGRFHFNGAGSNQTNYTLDGFNISNPVTGQLDARINIDTIQSMQVESSRFSADNGRGSSGMLELTSKMGDDHFRFNGTNFIPSVSTESGFHINKFTPRLEFSGPIKKGRAWFHNGSDISYNDDTVHGLPRGQNHVHSVAANDLSRFRVDLRPGNILTGSLLWNLNNITHSGLSFLSPIETTTNSRQTTFMSSLRDQQYFSGGALLDFGLADTRGFLHSAPQGNATYEITPFGNSGNYYVGLDRHFYRQQEMASLYLPTQHLRGTHLLKFGIDFEREAFHQEAFFHPYEVLRADQSVSRYVTFIGNPFEARKNFESAQYIQDHWNPRDDLSIETGLRAEWNEIARDIEFAPRLAAAWAPRSLGGTKFSAGWGVYYDAISLELVARQPSLMSMNTFYQPAGTAEGPVSTAFQVNDRTVTAPRYHTASVGVERKLPFEFYAKIGYSHRATNNGFTFDTTVPESGPAFYEGALYTLRNTRRDRYDALDISLKRTFAGKYEWFLGYTRSSSRTSAALEHSLESPIFAAQLPGPFPWNTPNRIHMWGWAPLPNGFLPRPLKFITRNTTAAYLAEYRTGFPFNVVTEDSFLLGMPGSMRYPNYFSLNLHFERQFRAMHYLWAARAGWDNVFNDRNPNFVNNVIGTPDFLAYGRGQARALTVRLRMLGKK